MHDIRFATRLLRRDLSFTAVAVLTLALGIGANTAVFSVVHAVLLRPLPFPEPDRLVQVMESRQRLGWARTSFTHANFWDVADESTSFAEIGAFRGASLTLTGADRPRRLAGRRVSPGFFRALGVTPVLGRFFDDGEEREDGDHRLAVLSTALWRSTFGSDPSVVGRTIQLDGEGCRVVGVAPPDEPFRSDLDIFVPLIRDAEPDRVSMELDIVGRLAPGVTAAEADAELATLAARLQQHHPEECRGVGLLTVPLRDWIAGDRLRQALWVLLGATGFLLLIACASLANMSLSQAVGRTREVALRSSLGAARSRIVRQLPTESVVLCAVGAVAGVALAAAMIAAFRLLAPASLPRLDLVSLNRWVLSFTSGLALVTAVLSGLVPAVMLRRVELAAALRSGERTSVGSRGSSALRSTLVGAEIAISLVLMVGAGLLTRSFFELLGADRGTETENRLIASVNLPSSYDAARTRAFFEQFLARTDAMPGVRSAAAVNFRPLLGASAGMGIATPQSPGVPGETVPWATWRMVTPGYFGTLGLEMRQGRDFGQDVIGDPWRVVLSESLASRLWPGGDAVGRTVVLWRGQGDLEADDIGVAFAPNASLNCTHPHFGEHPRELLYYAIHELHHVGFMTLHPPPKVADLETCADLLHLVRYLTQMEGMAVLAAWPRRRDEHALADDPDYVALEDAERMQDDLASYRKDVAYLAGRGGQPADADAWAVIERMSSGERLWYRVGAMMARDIESAKGRAALVELVRKGPDAFFAAYESLDPNRTERDEASSER